jgi:hypothetical protein
MEKRIKDTLFICSILAVVSSVILMGYFVLNTKSINIFVIIASILLAVYNTAFIFYLLFFIYADPVIGLDREELRKERDELVKVHTFYVQLAAKYKELIEIQIANEMRDGKKEG